MTDLSLVPLDSLIREMESRCATFICAYETFKNKDTLVIFRYGHGTWYKSVCLASILKNDVMNNWNGELQTLQRINEDDKHDEMPDL